MKKPFDLLQFFHELVAQVNDRIRGFEVVSGLWQNRFFLVLVDTRAQPWHVLFELDFILLFTFEWFCLLILIASNNRIVNMWNPYLFSYSRSIFMASKLQLTVRSLLSGNCIRAMVCRRIWCPSACIEWKNEDKEISSWLPRKLKPFR